MNLNFWVDEVWRLYGEGHTVYSALEIVKK